MTPKFTIRAEMGVAGQPGVEQLRTDLLLLTKLAGTDLGPGPQSVDAALDGLISRKMQEKKFTGQFGKKPILFDLDPTVHKDSPQRYVLLVGLGTINKFNHKVTCQVFSQLIDKAVELGVEHVTIPFPAKRMTGHLNLKATAHCLKEVLEKKLASLDEPTLKEVVLYCTPQARAHLQAGLRAPLRRHPERCCQDDE